MQFARFMASPLGRGGRVVIGVIMIVIGLMLAGPVGWIVAIAGLLPLALGVGNMCIMAPILHVPFKGADLP